MGKMDIMREAANRIRWIEGNGRYEYNEGIYAYILLLKLIAAGSFDRYFSECGHWQPIDRADAYDGKEDLGIGPLTTFEIDCLHALAQEIDRRENLAPPSRPQSSLRLV